LVSSSASAEYITTVVRAVSGSDRICASTPNPSTSGIMMSSNTTSACNSRNRSAAPFPSPTHNTSHPARPSSRRKVSHVSGLSSTIMIFGMDQLAPRLQ
jgi:hypothetical protein